MNGNSGYKFMLENIFDEATEDDKKCISTLLSFIKAQGRLNLHQQLESDKIIKKYRSSYHK